MLGSLKSRLCLAILIHISVILNAHPSLGVTDVLIISNNPESCKTLGMVEKLCNFYGLQFEVIKPDNLALRLRNISNSTSNKILSIVMDNVDFESMKNFDVVQSIKEMQEVHGTRLLVLMKESNRREDNRNGSILETLTGIRGLGVRILDGDIGFYHITDGNPEVTREFTGLTKNFPDGMEGKINVIVSEGNATKILPLIVVGRFNQNGEPKPIFGIIDGARGKTFVAAVQEINGECDQLVQCYNWQKLPECLPIMMFLRFSGGDRCWHRDFDLANLTIDDPNLIEPYGKLSYFDLLEHMKRYNFHTTIAFIPWNYDRTQKEVSDIFLKHPQYYSLVFHGNNHDHREFREYKEVPLADQMGDIAESIDRMEKFRKLTNVECDRAMIFPHAIAPAETLKILRDFDFLCTVNAGNIPLEATPSSRFDLNMKPANLDYYSFPSLDRRPVNDDLYVFDLFIDKPALFYGHVHDRKGIFSKDISGFDSIARKVNQISRKVQWMGLADLCRRLYLERLHRDGSIGVEMFCNKLILENRETTKQVFQIRKRESPDTQIASIQANGDIVKYSFKGDFIEFLLEIEPYGNAEVEIAYKTHLSREVCLVSSKGSPRIWLLRIGSEFRDRFLANNWVGLGIVNVWEKLGYKLFMALALCSVVLMVWGLSIVVVYVRRKKSRKKYGS
jgi:hypothetical protein